MFNSPYSLFITLLLSVALVALLSCSQETDEGHSEDADRAEATMAAPDEDGEEMAAWNKVCPIRGEEVSAEAPTVEYKGKTYGFCCPGCDEKFNADPENYAKNLSEDGSKFIGG